ncbi:hypothetical protein M378DRAFT_156329 [Amanita muscaria Koide BX008]|uniref:20S-pre-rRNA D-site endonuclease NOB1 n=1 Tax=Amanita muscaria (strain Koide BX008) TaxID=946122 RepID=A0A0C2T303_AMAMK|nr:hypothetical protein M378DRAFT_156329 [Amanita muscaria Koide BX008]
MATQQNPRCKHLVLDAGPLLALTPLRGLSEAYYTVPQVLAELKDKKARDHIEQLALLSGVKVIVKSPDPASISHVIQCSKKTGDYSVLSHPDLCVLALTYMLHKGEKLTETENHGIIETVQQDSTSLAAVDVNEIAEGIENLTASDDISSESDSTVEPAEKEKGDNEGIEESGDNEPLDVELHPIKNEDQSLPPIPTQEAPSTTSGFEDPSDEDDGEGEWITPDNVDLHKSKALGLLPSESDGNTKDEEIWAGCMTADFAMQNVLLQMGLNLVSLEGRRIEKVKTWVLRCHACYKLCKDNSKKFCPSCGNPTLIRASVTVAKPGADPKAPAVQVHLKKNFQYKLRGTKYSIPAPKPGSAKTGSGEGLVLREDQLEYMNAKKRLDNKREREEARMLKGMAARAATGNMGVLSSWMDPDWVPEMISASAGGKGRTKNSNGDLPQVGHGKRNPNERRRSRK